MLNVRISSRAFSSGFNIGTPVEVLSARRTPLSPTGQILIFDNSENQLARLELESFLSSVYHIIISGGGFYQFARDTKSKRSWTCKGEGKLLCLAERTSRKFFVSEGAQDIAECTQTWLTSGYEINILNDADLRLVICMFIALWESEDKGASAM